MMTAKTTMTITFITMVILNLISITMSMIITLMTIDTTMTKDVNNDDKAK